MSDPLIIGTWHILGAVATIVVSGITVVGVIHVAWLGPLHKKSGEFEGWKQKVDTKFEASDKWKEDHQKTHDRNYDAIDRRLTEIEKTESNILQSVGELKGIVVSRTSK